MPHEANHSPHSAYIINYHMVWIPRYRKEVLVRPVEARLKELLAEIATQYGFEILAVEVTPVLAAHEVRLRRCASVPDHVHLFVSAPPKFAPAEIVGLFKGITSRRLRKSLKASVASIGANMQRCGPKDTMLVRQVTLARKPSNAISRKAKRNNFKY